ncbi:MAG: hypothetical protein ACREQ4_16375 [Candidatus Binataceae bacterium]
MNQNVPRRQFLAQTGQAVLAASVLGRFSLSAGADTGKAMPVNYLTYSLLDGWVGNWLVAGPLLIAVPDVYKGDPSGRALLFEKYYSAEPLVTGPFVEGDAFNVGDAPLTWRYYACKEDHQLDFTSWFMRPSYARVWAYVEIESEAAHDVAGELFSQGHVDIWQGGKHIHHSDAFDLSNLQRSNFSMRIEPGVNPLLLRFATASVNNTEFSQALRLDGLPADTTKLRVPVHTADVARRQALEAAFQQAYMNRDVFYGADEIRLRVPQLAANAGAVRIALNDSGKTMRRATWGTGDKADFVSLGTADGLPAGYAVEVTLDASGNRRAIPIEIAEGPFALTPRAGTTLKARRHELLEFVVQVARRTKIDVTGGANVSMWDSRHLCAEIAKMALGRWQEVSSETLIAYAQGVARHQDGGEFRLIELLGALDRWGKDPRFPKSAAAAIEEAALGFRYWTDEPGQSTAYYNSENHEFGYHVSEILAGQLWPDRVFTNNKQDGRWHRQHGEQLALGWLRQRGSCGFDEWDADGYLAMDAEVLAHLAELAQTPRLQTLSRTLLDKLHFSLALNSFAGCFGSTHGRTKVEYVKYAGNEETASLAYLGWGLAGINESADLAVAVVCAGYEPPPVIQAIALDQPEAMWDRERQGLMVRQDTGEEHGLVDTVTFKTRDYMLSSAQSYKPGQGGHQEHIWQATFGPTAVVFGNVPACASEDTDRRPNFWVGNQTLPRVVQWKDALISIDKMRDNDWMNFTHAWFPTGAFDEFVVKDNWAFARKGDGYLALTAARGLSLITRGDTAQRELRSTGRQNVWFCQMGRAAQDRDFAVFQRKVLALPVRFGDLSVNLTTLRGETLEFGWDSPLLVNGRETPITGFKHFENPYCVAEWPTPKMNIHFGGQTLTLDFS